MAVERAAGGTSLIDVLDRVLDKGIVIDAWVRVSLVGIDLITVEARVVVASIDTYLKYSEAVGAATAAARPGIEAPRPYEEIAAENVALRAQLEGVTVHGDSADADAGAATHAGNAVNGQCTDAQSVAVRAVSGAPIARRITSMSSLPVAEHVACAGMRPSIAARARSSCSSTTSSITRICRAARRPASSGSPGTRASRRSVCLAVDGEAEHARGRRRRRRLRARTSSCFLARSRTRTIRSSRALTAPAPTRLRAAATTVIGAHSATPFGAAPFIAVPLRGDRDTTTTLSACCWCGPATSVTGDVNWLVTVLGQKLDQIRGRGSLAEELRKLRRERALFFTIINSVTDPILLTDTEGRLIVANARAEKLFAASEEESEGRRRAVELNNMLFSAALSRTAVEAPSEARELLLVDPSDGSDLLFEVLSTTVEDPREGTGIVSVLRNITDLRRATEQIEENYQKLRMAEAAVRAERDRLNLIIDSVADPIIVTDQSGATVLMNAPAEELFTVAAGRRRRRSARVQSNDAHFSSFISGLLLGESGPGEIRRGEIGLMNPLSGEPIPVEAIAGKVLTETGELTAVVTILHDRREALERARLYEQLKRASDELQMRVQSATAELATQNELLRRQAIELEQASRLKSQFLANMSHEFRTPLNAILGYTHMLLQGVAGDLPPNVKRQLTRIDSNGRHLLTIINEILDITRIEAGKMPMQISEFNLNELVRK